MLHTISYIRTYTSDFKINRSRERKREREKESISQGLGVGRRRNRMYSLSMTCDDLFRAHTEISVLWFWALRTIRRVSKLFARPIATYPAPGKLDNPVTSTSTASKLCPWHLWTVEALLLATPVGLTSYFRSFLRLAFDRCEGVDA